MSSSKKTIELSEQLQKQKVEFEEVAKLFDESVEEDSNKIERVSEKIKELVTKEGLFCGVILTTESILEILRVHINSNEPVEIPFNLYFRES